MRKNKKLFLCFSFLFYSSLLGFTQSISIGVINPFLYQTSTETLLIKSNLIFEIFSDIILQINILEVNNE
jgi:hypothetical protein